MDVAGIAPPGYPIVIVGAAFIYCPVVAYRAPDGSRPGALLRLRGLEEPMFLAPTHPAPFGTYADEIWRCMEGGAQEAVSSDRTLCRALWLVDSVIGQWERSTREGAPYLRAGEAPCPAPLPEVMRHPPAEAHPPPPAPVLLCFGWVYPLRRGADGPVTLAGETYRTTSPLPVERWWGMYARSVRAALSTCEGRAPGREQAETPSPAVRAFRERVGHSRQFTLYHDGRLSIMWSARSDVFSFRMPFMPYCLEDDEGRVYRFSGGVLEVSAPARVLSAFLDCPAQHLPTVRVLADRPEARNPFVSGDNTLCDAGNFARSIARESGLSPGAMILRALDDSIRILMLGGGKVRHTPFRSPAESGAPRITAQTAQRRNIPVFRWDHDQRGMEAVRLG